jgi:nucleoside-diphosphate-sugar epimerase
MFFVTGGTGHIGPYIISELIAAGHEVDITNPVAPDHPRLVTPQGSSGAQETAKDSPSARTS